MSAYYNRQRVTFKCHTLRMYKPAQDDPMCAYTARLMAWHARQARRIGSDNMGDGMRKSIEFTSHVAGLFHSDPNIGIVLALQFLSANKKPPGEGG